ncbi:hypothetical protein OG21DRAFT_1526977 [Imleria badia]|nr:hypothetical protein OG21DRAFT_1526977 [Imleria badia]
MYSLLALITIDTAAGSSKGDPEPRLSVDDVDLQARLTRRTRERGDYAILVVVVIASVVTKSEGNPQKEMRRLRGTNCWRGITAKVEFSSEQGRKTPVLLVPGNGRDHEAQRMLLESYWGLRLGASHHSPPRPYREEPGSGYFKAMRQRVARNRVSAQGMGMILETNCKILPSFFVRTGVCRGGGGDEG